MRERLSGFFAGRNGNDDLNRFLCIFALAATVLGMFFSPASSVGMAMIIIATFRMCSKNLYKRSQENESYKRLRATVKTRIGFGKTRLLQTKTHHFYKCPACKAELRVPKGKGKIAITCPKCQHEFVKKS